MYIQRGGPVRFLKSTYDGNMPVKGGGGKAACRPGRYIYHTAKWALQRIDLQVLTMGGTRKILSETEEGIKEPDKKPSYELKQETIEGNLKETLSDPKRLRKETKSGTRTETLSWRRDDEERNHARNQKRNSFRTKENG
jgi:hypothetical protein